jgi:hypothetical protein
LFVCIEYCKLFIVVIFWLVGGTSIAVLVTIAFWLDIYRLVRDIVYCLLQSLLLLLSLAVSGIWSWLQGLVPCTCIWFCICIARQICSACYLEGYWSERYTTGLQIIVSIVAVAYTLYYTSAGRVIIIITNIVLTRTEASILATPIVVYRIIRRRLYIRRRIRPRAAILEGLAFVSIAVVATVGYLVEERCFGIDCFYKVLYRSVWIRYRYLYTNREVQPILYCYKLIVD